MMIKGQIGRAAALISIAFLLGTAVVGCEKETTTTIPVAGAREPGRSGSTGRSGAAPAAPPQILGENLGVINHDYERQRSGRFHHDHRQELDPKDQLTALR